MSENLYIKSNRYSNPEYREEYDRIFKDKDSSEWSSDNDGYVYFNGVLVGRPPYSELECDIQTEMGKGKVLGHFI